MRYMNEKQTQTPFADAIPLRPVPMPAYVMARIETMHPAYFALVMATGIVAIACHLHGLNELAQVLGLLNVVMYPVLWLLFLVRLIKFPRRVLSDCMSHQRATGYFTTVAATSVLGSQTVHLYGNTDTATVLWWVALVLWAVATYGVFSILVTRDEKPALSDGINGGWLVAVVATQSIVVLGCTVNRPLIGDRDTTLYILLSFWLCGGMLYFWIISLIFYRNLFFRFSPGELMPPYWINMGSVAISTLAGASLARLANTSDVFGPMLPFIQGFTVMFWATATWWIPMLIVLGIWRHFIRKYPIAYDPLYWGLVFPLGMYAVCTFQLGHIIEIPVLFSIASIFVIAATVSWLLTFMGMLRRLEFLAALAYFHTRSIRVENRVASTHDNQEAESNEYQFVPKQG